MLFIGVVVGVLFIIRGILNFVVLIELYNFQIPTFIDINLIDSIVIQIYLIY